LIKEEFANSAESTNDHAGVCAHSLRKRYKLDEEVLRDPARLLRKSLTQSRVRYIEL